MSYVGRAAQAHQRYLLRVMNEQKLLARARLRFVLCILVGLVISVACERDTRVAISNLKQPPTFTLSGSGSLVLFIVVGPYRTEAELDSPPSDVHAIWEISTESNASVSSLPAITYGKVPPGFTQITPASGSPPALEEGRFYVSVRPATMPA